MISFSTTQLDYWLATLAFPLARILGMLANVPVFNNVAQPRRIRLLVGLLITLALSPALPPMPTIPVSSWVGLLVIAQQILVGTLLGFTLRIAFAAVDLAGELIGMQMSLSFAVFYDPQNAGQTPVLAEFLGLLSSLIFLAMNGHLLVLSVLGESFKLMPVTTVPMHIGGLSSFIAWSSALFSSGLLLALPLVAALLVTNLAMGVLARVAPQLNIFAVGFPVTLMAGFVVLMFSIPFLGSALELLFDNAFKAMHAVMQST